MPTPVPDSMASTSRPFRFGLQSYTATSATEWKERARKAEALGYSAFMLADHYIGDGPKLAATHHPAQGMADDGDAHRVGVHAELGEQHA